MISDDFRKQDEMVREQDEKIKAVINPAAQGVIFVVAVGAFIVLMALLGRFLNVCQLVRWVFCKEC